MNTTKHENHGAVAGQVDCRVRPQRDGVDRARFEAWYDAQPQGKLNPWDVWQAGAQDASAEIARLRAALADVVDTDWAYLQHDADTARPDSLYNRVRRGRLALGPNVHSPDHASSEDQT